MGNSNKKDFNSDISEIEVRIKEYFGSRELYEDAQKRCIKKALEYHLEHNEQYKNYFNQFSDAVEMMKEDKFDTSKIPLLPSSLFKKQGVNLASVDKDEIAKYCTSSGTRGSLSIVPRDNGTLINFFSSISTVFPEIFDMIYPGTYKVLILGPSPEKAGDLWFAYAISSLALEYDTEYFFHNGDYLLDKVMEKMVAATKENKNVVVIGAPPTIVDLCKKIKEDVEKIPLGSGAYIISAGGWKRRNNEAITKQEYLDVVTDAFDIATEQVRDCYNMVELNSIICECSCHKKHVYPWLDVFARDPKTNEVLPDGEEGILCFYDGGAFSYPGFIMSEDYGRVSSETCKCGRVGKTIEIVRRMEKVEARGCALKMDAGLVKMGKQQGSNRFYKSYFRNPELFQDKIQKKQK